MMSKLILFPTDTCQWHALVNEAQAATQLTLNEDTESYLVFLLKRFSESTQWVESMVALDFLEAMKASCHRQAELLRDVGDKSLLFSGLFPGIAERRNVRLDYFTSMGQSAYLTVGEMESPESAELYFQLSEQFITMQNILQSMRGHYCQAANPDFDVILINDHRIQ
jgi:hypothetical protein